MPPVEEEYGDEVWAPLVSAPMLPSPPSERSLSLVLVSMQVGERLVNEEYKVGATMAAGQADNIW